MSNRDWSAYRAVARGGIIACVLLLGLGATSNPPTPGGGNTQAQHQSPASQEHTNSNSGDDASPKPIFIEIEQPPGVKPIATETKDERQWYATPDWWVAGFTGLLFIATAGLWIFTGLMWKATKRVAVDSEKSIKAANRSAKAAEDVLAHTRETSESELRAYLGIDLSDPKMSTIEISAAGHGYLAAKVLVKNFGRTPAFNVRSTNQIEIRETPLNGSLGVHPDVSGSSTINPCQILVITNDRNGMILPSMIQNINAEKQAIYLKGRLDFTDAFDKPRWVEFFMYSHSGNGGMANFWLCDTGNETSESQKSKS